jgi:hypothetical protein
MTRDETIEKVARAICRVQHNGCGAEACDGIFNLDDCCSGHIKFWEAAEASIATLESMGYHIDGTGKMVAPPAETTPAPEQAS